MQTLLPRNLGILPIILFACGILVIWQPLLATTAPTRQSKPRIEVCFVLDTTGSMGGLIEGAKQKIWSIANEMISAKPTPQLKLGLIGYRDRGDEYVVKSFNLTDDIDSIYGHLSEFKADGGGDTPEAVNTALHDAVNRISWSQGGDAYRVVFLVGDAPPHDYQDEPSTAEIVKAATARGIVVNTILAGGDPDARAKWQQIASLNQGKFFEVEQS
ncbi:MAG TPA: vWA domain-containing protein, partial [Pyrinomonadaceae bacterium]|nr:vWA domain-containing protein [Pyrinomonadaceae bacterium]